MHAFEKGWILKPPSQLEMEALANSKLEISEILHQFSCVLYLANKIKWSDESVLASFASLWFYKGVIFFNFQGILFLVLICKISDFDTQT